MRLVRLCAWFALIIFALIAISGRPAPWTNWRPATCLPDACFCEAIDAGFIRQPIATWSNLAFVLLGLLILEDVLRPAATRSNLLAQRRTYGGAYAVAVILIGLGSWFYHASLTFAGQWFDVMGMYLLGTFMVLYNASRIPPSAPPLHGQGVSGTQQRGVQSKGASAFAANYVLFNLALGFSLIVIPELRRYLFGMLLIVAIALEVMLRQRRNRVSQSQGESQTNLRNPVSADLRYFIAALLIYLLAQISWVFDLNRIVCDPDSLLQGHAVWHILTALSAGLLYLYYRSEIDPRVDANNTSA